MRRLGYFVLCMLAYVNLLAWQSTTTEIEGTVVQNHNQLRSYNEDLLHRLDSLGVPLPDSVVVTDVKNLLVLRDPIGFVPHSSRTVYLTHNEKRIDLSKTDAPYIVGSTEITAPDSLERAFVLAHEIAHVLENQFADMPRPALGEPPSENPPTTETEADIVGLILMHQAYGVTAPELGFPILVRYDEGLKQVVTMRRAYCRFLNESFDLSLLCSE